jgi:hypothetical protein
MEICRRWRFVEDGVASSACIRKGIDTIALDNLDHNPLHSLLFMALELASLNFLQRTTLVRTDHQLLYHYLELASIIFQIAMPSFQLFL